MILNFIITIVDKLQKNDKKHKTVIRLMKIVYFSKLQIISISQFEILSVN